jgi:thiol-disulfide isomerase/thioredoxin
MRNIIVIFILIFLSLTASFIFYNKKPEPIDIIKPLKKSQTNIKILQKVKVPNTKLTLINNQKIKIYDFQGKVLLINFWASWCPPCLKEFELFSQLLKKHPKKYAIIAISQDHDLKKMDKFIKIFRKKYPWSKIYFVHDPKKKISQEIFNIFKIPETIILDKNSYLDKKIIGTPSAPLEIILR